MAPKDFDPNKTLFDMIANIGGKMDAMNGNYSDMRVEMAKMNGNMEIISKRLEDGDEKFHDHMEAIKTQETNFKSLPCQQPSSVACSSNPQSQGITINWKRTATTSGIGSLIAGFGIVAYEIISKLLMGGK